MAEQNMQGCHLVPQADFVAPSYAAMHSIATGGEFCTNSSHLKVPSTPGCNIVLDHAFLQDDMVSLMRWLGLVHERMPEAADSHWHLVRSQ